MPKALGHQALDSRLVLRARKRAEPVARQAGVARATALDDLECCLQAPARGTRGDVVELRGDLIEPAIEPLDHGHGHELIL